MDKIQNTIDLPKIEKPKIIKFFEKIDVQKNINDKINFLLSPEELSFDEFKSNLLRINGIIRGVNKEDRFLSYEVNLGTMHGINYLPPENKEYFLEKLYSNLSELKNNEDRAELLFYGIQFIHPFSDGNGRTGRFLYHMLKNNYDMKNIKKINPIKEQSSEKNRKEFEKNIPSAEFLGYLGKKSFYELEGIKEKGGIYSVGQNGFYNFIENKELDQNKYEHVKKIINGNSMNIYNFRDLILYKINKYKKNSEVNYIRHIDKIKIDGELILDNLNNEDLDFIIMEYDKYQEYFMGKMLNTENIQIYSNILKDNNVKFSSELFKISI